MNTQQELLYQLILAKNDELVAKSDQLIAEAEALLQKPIPSTEA
jgi:hypothetical protein